MLSGAMKPDARGLGVGFAGLRRTMGNGAKRGTCMWECRTHRIPQQLPR